VELALPPINHPRSYADQDRRIADAIREIARKANGRVRILEAGCGNRWPIELPDLDCHLTGVDLDATALQIRQYVQKDLHESIHGDLCTVDLGTATFDVVYCAYVLEHIRAADVALSNLVRALKPGGLLVLRVPDPHTARGLVTSATPFWFHVFYHRVVMKRPTAGKPGHAPYPTYYHPVISESGMSRFAKMHGLSCHARLVDSFARDGRGIAGVVFRLGARMVHVITAGHYTSEYSDIVYLFRKQVPASDRISGSGTRTGRADVVAA
jgi:SAM-dependent methyltransferase